MDAITAKLIKDELQIKHILGRIIIWIEIILIYKLWQVVGTKRDVL